MLRKTGVVEKLSVRLITSDAGSQYRCGRVGRGIQPQASPPPPPQAPSYTLTHTQ